MSGDGTTGRIAALACPVCTGMQLDHRMRLRTQYGDRREMYSIWTCRDCAYSFASGRTDEAFLSAIYNAGFHDTAQQRAEAEDEASFSVVINAGERAAWLEQRGLGGTLLDVGAGKGYFVRAASRYFAAYGIEVADTAAAFARARGAPVTTGDFLDHAGDAGGYDVVTLWDVLASLRDPHAAMSRITALLRPGGHVVLTVPVATAVTARVLGRFWPLWIPPINLGYYSRESLRILLERHGLALESFEFRPKRVAVSFVLEKLMRSAGVYAPLPLIRKIPARWQLRLNLHDIATVIAVKRPASSA